MSKLSQFIIKHKVDVKDGYAVAYAVERLATAYRCSEDEILTDALNDADAAQYLLKLSRRLANV